MTYLSEQLAGSRALLDLADDMRLEARCWPDKRVRAGLERNAQQIEAAARAALTDSAAYSDAWLVAGRLYLSGHIVQRRFIQALSPVGQRVRRPILTLDCRDGQHTACAICDCPCHKWADE